MTGSDKAGVSLRSVANQPSETAMATAMLRALAAHDECEEIKGPDYLAENFLTEDRRAPLNDPAKRKWVLQNKVSPGAYEFMIARTAFFDHVVREALEANLPQIVFLGAGYDTRPYRFKDLARDTRIFELDAAPTQLRKREILEQTATPMPAKIKFLPIDFSHDDLQAVLLAAGFSTAAPALFIWEGVTYYLTAEAVDATLAAVRSLSAGGGSICFDYTALSSDAISEERARKLREHLRSNHPGEPAKFGIPSGRLEAFLNERGYRLIKCVNSTEMEARYLTLQDGSVLGKVAALFALVHASVKQPARKNEAITMNESDIKNLLYAIAVARQSREHGNHPFGAILVGDDNQVLLEAENTVLTGRDPTGHAETNLVRMASLDYSPEELASCTLYTSTEPCAMCAGAIHWSGIGRVVYALSETDLYAMVGPSPEHLLLPCREVFAHSQRQVEVVGPVPILEKEARAVHEGFWTK